MQYGTDKLHLSKEEISLIVDPKEKAKIRLKIYWTALKTRVFEHYSQERVCCACCGESNMAFLTLDHINNDGAEHRRKIGRGFYQTLTWIKQNNFPEGFQVLCYNCNQAKKTHGGNCPHNLVEDISE